MDPPQGFSPYKVLPQEHIRLGQKADKNEYPTLAQYSDLFLLKTSLHFYLFCLEYSDELWLVF